MPAWKLRACHIHLQRFKEICNEIRSLLHSTLVNVGGSGGTQPHNPNHSTTWMLVANFMPWSLYLRMSARHPLDRRLVESRRESVRCNDKGKPSLLEIKPWSLSHPTCGLITMLTQFPNNETIGEIIFTRFLLVYTHTLLDEGGD
jgi:hypothetical protein